MRLIIGAIVFVGICVGILFALSGCNQVDSQPSWTYDSVCDRKVYTNDGSEVVDKEKLCVKE